MVSAVRVETPCQGVSKLSLTAQRGDAMICHVVLYQLKPEVSKEDEQWLMAEARKRIPLVPGVKNLKVGRSIRGAEKGYSIALVMDLPDEAGLEAYRIDPGHQEFINEVANPLVSEVLRFDFRAD
jgi:stress responsive alpha/beta barrel protein